MRRVRAPLSSPPPRLHIPFLLRATDAFAFCFICISAGVVDLYEAKAQFGGHGLFEVTLARGVEIRFVSSLYF